jgi:AraC family transcriptional regulator, transcriptional activator of pobA
MSKKQSTKSPTIPQYPLKGFRKQHRHEDELSNFGYNNLAAIQPIDGFELFSSKGVRPHMGPLKSAFYRVSICIKGNVDIQVGLEKFKHKAGGLAFTWPNQVFWKGNISADAFGYYVLFNADFLNELIPSAKMAEEFPFLDYNGTPVFYLAPEELQQIEHFVLKMNEELHGNRPGREKAIRMYLYLLLLEAKRSYERQQLHISTQHNDSAYLVSRYQKLVSQHFLLQRKVADYAQQLAITPNHLNRVVKEVTGKTASDAISDMLAQEAKAVLKYTDASIAEIAYQLNFSEPASFNRFFKKMTGETPLAFRQRA